MVDPDPGTDKVHDTYVARDRFRDRPTAVR